ncbi:MAG: 4Fe-4S binding protein [Thioalkalivibrio sp.]|nr:4Fe-4S binding protein [Thioalkalivibrio sp.]
MSTASSSGSPLKLPPPQYHASICAAGEDGETGCRRCVDSCPYLAMRPLATPEGTVIHIDGGLCQRCGACTGVCPTGALERAFLPDDELIRLLEEAVPEAPAAPLLVVAGREHDAALGAFSPPSGPVARVTLPSLLILNENHFLHAARLGAAGIAVVGGPLSHHGSPALIEDALDLSEALGGLPTRYVEARAATQIAAELTAFADSLPVRNPPPEPTLAPRGRRREQLAALVQGSTVPSAPVPEAAFGRVSIQADGCTLCGACSRSCPTDALSFHPAQGTLTFEPIACVGCGLCEAACPEQVLTLTPGLPVGVDLLAPQTLVEDTVAACVSCGAPHLPERLLRSVRNLLDGRSDLPAEVAQIDRCPACRTIGVLEPEPVSAPPVARPAESGCGCSSETCCSSQPAQPTPAAPGVGRRSFLQGVGTALSALATLAAGGAPAQTPAGPAAAAPKARRLGMVIDLEKCIGCQTSATSAPTGSTRD